MNDYQGTTPENLDHTRRRFLASGTTAAAAGLLASGAAAQQHQHAEHVPTDDSSQAERQQPRESHDDENQYDGFSRWHPSRGNDPDSPYYLGKLVSGRRSPAEQPPPFFAPDLDKLPYRLNGGYKEFHVVAQPVRRELLPGYWMNFYGYNGSMPGPTIEVVQGDRVRIVVTNELTEETVVHLHGFEPPVQYDGAGTLTQNMIQPGKHFVYEFDVHEEGTFFYHSHVAMQEAFGMVGWLIVHPRNPFDPPVDRDFGLIFQNFSIDANQSIPDSWAMEWHWHTINGRSGPYATPLVCRHGERVRIRIMDFSPMQHHPIHLHGHQFWVTGHEGARAPKSAWIPRNNELIGVAQASVLELVANNPGDWMLHCHMVHHMMNHMVKQVGPRIREDVSVDRYLANIDNRPEAKVSSTARGLQPPGYPQIMKGMEMSDQFMQKVWSRRAVKGMRAMWPMATMGLMTVLRVLPDDLYHRVMETDEEIPKGEIFAEIVRRYGDPARYEPTSKGMEGMHGHH